MLTIKDYTVYSLGEQKVKTLFDVLSLCVECVVNIKMFLNIFREKDTKREDRTYRDIEIDD